jgi:hypothetical protein
VSNRDSPIRDYFQKVDFVGFAHALALGTRTDPMTEGLAEGSLNIVYA